MNEDDKNSILPPNATKLQKDLENVIALRLGKINIPNRWLMNPDKCPEYLLPWLAWAVSVDSWNNNWALETRRSVIKASIEIHKRKGTVGALKKALNSLNLDNVKLEEWFEYGGEPFYFRVSTEVLTADFDVMELNEVYSIIQKTKNVRSHLESLIAYLTTKSIMPFISGSIVSGEIITIYPREQDSPE